MQPITQKQAQPWWLMQLHNLCYALMGVTLLIYPMRSSALHTGLLGGLLLLAGFSTALLSSRLSRSGQIDSIWFTLSSIRNLIFGLILLVDMGSSVQTMVNILGLWAIVYAFMQAIKAMFYFLGTRYNQDKDYWVEVIHFVCVFITGGFAFVLIMRPAGLPTSLGFSGLFLLGLAIIQVVLTQRLRASAH